MPTYRTHILSSLLLILVGCGQGYKSSPATTTGAEASTINANAMVAKTYDLNDEQSTADAARGFLASPSGQVKNAAGEVLLDYDSFQFVHGAAPTTVNPSLWRQARLNNNIGLFKVRDGIYQLRGFDLANITLIEGKTGWIVVDSLTSRETAQTAMAFARKYLGNKAVTGVIFTHSHVDHFGGALGVISAEEVARRQVPVLAPEGFVEEATSENILLGPAMGRRAMYMYGSRLPHSVTGLIDDGLGKSVAIGSVGILEPSLLITHSGQEAVIDGVQFVFQTVPGSEAPAEMTFYLPTFKAYCGAEMLSHTMHNLYTLRGAKVRDPIKWSSYIDEAMRDSLVKNAEVYFGQHHWPVWGQARIQDFLLHQRDVYRYTHDQTVRLINSGLSAGEIAERLSLPKALDQFLDVHGYYGTLSHNAKAVYQYYQGWFDGNPAHLNPLPMDEAGKRYVALAGGADKLVASAQQAFDAGEYRWSAELLAHLMFAQPGHAKGRELLARSYEQLGYTAESGPWRNFYLTGAYELRNGLPKVGITPALALDMLDHAPIENFLQALAASLNGPDAEGKKLSINLNFSDLGVNYVLELDNSVLWYHKAPASANANASLSLTKAIFLKMMTGTAGVKDTLLSDDLKISGSKVDLIRFFSLFDKAPGTFPILTRK